MNLDLSVLAQYGVLGVVLAWFMFRVERKLDSHTTVINDLAKSILLDVLSRENLSDHLKEQATSLLDQVTSRAASLREMSRPH